MGEVFESREFKLLHELPVRTNGDGRYSASLLLLLVAIVPVLVTVAPLLESSPFWRIALLALPLGGTGALLHVAARAALRSTGLPRRSLLERGWLGGLIFHQAERLLVILLFVVESGVGTLALIVVLVLV